MTKGDVDSGGGLLCGGANNHIERKIPQVHIRHVQSGNLLHQCILLRDVTRVILVTHVMDAVA